MHLNGWVILEGLSYSDNNVLESLAGGVVGWLIFSAVPTFFERDPISRDLEVSLTLFMVVSKIFYVQPLLGKLSNLTYIFQMG